MASKPDQKGDPLGGPFGSTAISKSCFRNFQGRSSNEQRYQEILRILPFSTVATIVTKIIASVDYGSISNGENGAIGFKWWLSKGYRYWKVPTSPLQSVCVAIEMRRCSHWNGDDSINCRSTMDFMTNGCAIVSKNSSYFCQAKYLLIQQSCIFLFFIFISWYNYDLCVINNSSDLTILKITPR